MHLLSPWLLLAGALGAAGAGSPAASPHGAGAPVIYLDAGHGGLNHGAVGVDGLREKDVTLDVTRRLAALLTARTDARVVVSRDEDDFVGLRARTRHANRVGADVFLSIHANANASPDLEGIEVYLLAADTARDEGLDIVRREEGAYAASDPHAGHDHGPGRALGSVLHGVRLAGAQRAAARLALVVLDALGDATGAPKRSVRQAPFAVLKEAQMPALVVEIGYLTNPAEAARLAREDYRAKVAEGLFEALQRWPATAQARAAEAPQSP